MWSRRPGVNKIYKGESVAEMKKPYIPQWIFEQGWTHTQVSIYCYICMRGECFENKSKISKTLGMSKNTFYRHLEKLIDNGWITQGWRGRSRTLTATNSGKCIKRDTLPVSKEIHYVSQKRDNTCRKIDTLTNQRTNQTTDQRTKDKLFALVYNAGSEMRGDGPTKEDRQWREEVDSAEFG